MAGDFNTPNCTFHDNPLIALLRELVLVQHINFPTHRLGDILDLIITPKPNSPLIQDIGRKTFDSNQYLILCSLNLAPPPLPSFIVISRSFVSVFEKNLRHIHNTLTIYSDVPVEEFPTKLNNSFQLLIDQHAPLRTHIFCPSSHSHHKLSINETTPQSKVDKHLSEKIQTNTDIIQGDCLSATLYIFYLASCLNSPQSKINPNNEKFLNEPKYADDIIWVTTSKQHRKCRIKNTNTVSTIQP